MNRTEIDDANGVWNRIVSTYSIGQDVTRRVGKVVPSLGVFVSIEPDFDALIHISKIIGLGDQDPRRFYTAGQEVTAKVINIDSHAHRVELSTNLYEFSFEKFLTENDQIVMQDVNLADIEVTGVVLYGAWIQDRPNARVELVTRSENKMSFQAQAKCAHNGHQALKCVHVVIHQKGKDILAKVDWAAITTSDHDYGFDLTAISKRELSEPYDEGKVEIASSADIEDREAQGYGVAELHFRKKPARTPQLNGEHQLLKRTSKSILVDGSNIVRCWPQLQSEALAGLVEGLKANGYVPTVIFDANIEHVLTDNKDVFGQNLVRNMLRGDPDHTIIVPSGMRSDDYMLLLADRREYQIVSCDTYRDEAFAKYSWLRNRVESGEKRVHAPAFILGDLVVPTLGIVWPFAPLCINAIPFKGDAFIQAIGNGEYFCAEAESQGQQRKIMANRDNPSDWEKFLLIHNSDGTVSIKSKINDRFLSVEINTDGCLNARASEIREWEKFWLARRANDGLCTLRSYANMKYVAVSPRIGQVAALSDIANEWSWLDIKPAIQF